MTEKKPIRVPVKYDYAAIHPEFLKMLAEIGSYANTKYGSYTAYLEERLTGDADPINHIYEHARSYQMRERYDHFEGDPRRHLAAIAYNAMMMFATETKWGPEPSVYLDDDDESPWPTYDPDDSDDEDENENVDSAPSTLGKVVDGKFVAAPLVKSETDWAEGLAYFRERWADGLTGARDPGSIRRWQAMIWVLSQFDEVARTDEAIFGVMADIRAAAMAQLEALATPENIEEQKAKIAALDTLRAKIPDMFLKKVVDG